MNGAVKRLVIVGRDAPAWLSACVMQYALAPAGVNVCVVELPPSLRHKLRLFDARGHVPYFKDGFFSRDSWLAVLFGQGLMPGAYDRIADFMPAGLLDARLRELHARVAAHVTSMPGHADVIERHCREPWIAQQVAS